jgi:hypothetical protein
MTTPDDVVLTSCGTRNYTTITIDAPALPDCLRALAAYLESPEGNSFQFDSLTHSTREGRSRLLVDLSSREYRLNH